MGEGLGFGLGSIYRDREEDRKERNWGVSEKAKNLYKNNQTIREQRMRGWQEEEEDVHRVK